MAINFNGHHYDWSKVRVSIAGTQTEFGGLQEVSCEPSQETEYVFGTGSEPLHVSKGNRTYTGNLSLLLGELEWLEKSIPSASILDVTFDLQVSIEDPSRPGGIVTYLIGGIVIEKSPRNFKQNDKMFVVAMSFKALKFSKI